MGRKSFFVNNRFDDNEEIIDKPEQLSNTKAETDTIKSEASVKGYKAIPYSKFKKIAQAMKWLAEDTEKWKIDVKTPQEYQERGTKFFVTDKRSIFAIDKNGEILTLGKSLSDKNKYSDLINMAKKEGANKAYCFGDKFVEFYEECGFIEDISKRENVRNMPEDFVGNANDKTRHFMEIRDEPNREIAEREPTNSDVQNKGAEVKEEIREDNKKKIAADGKKENLVEDEKENPNDTITAEQQKRLEQEQRLKTVIMEKDKLARHGVYTNDDMMKLTKLIVEERNLTKELNPNGKNIGITFNGR